LDELILADHTFWRGPPTDQLPSQACAYADKKSAMYLKRRPPKSLPWPSSSGKKLAPSPFEEAVRKDSAVHVSLSSDSPVKQPGNLAVASPQPAEAYCRADEAGPPTTSRRSDPHV